jgi:hypothetical protein
MKDILEKDDLVAGFLAGLLITAAFNFPVIQTFAATHGFAILGSVTAGSFLAFYKLALWIYRKWIWPLVHRNELLSGHWVYLLTTERDKRQSVGYFTIKHRRHGMHFCDVSVWYAEEANPSLANARGGWACRAATLESDELWILFEMHDGGGAKQSPISTTDPDAARVLAGKNYRGLITLARSGSPATVLSGRFQDLDGRLKKRGPMVCAKVARKAKPETIQGFR